MDVDCDGHQSSNSLCDMSGDTQGEKAFKDEVKKYGIPDLDSSIHSFVVFGNENPGNKAGFAALDPTEYGIQHLSLMAVVCNTSW